MIAQDKSGAICVNTAEVPRITRLHSGDSAAGNVRQHQFTVVEFDGTKVLSIESVWVAVCRRTQECRTACSQPLIRRGEAGLELWDGHESTWVTAGVMQTA